MRYSIAAAVLLAGCGATTGDGPEVGAQSPQSIPEVDAGGTAVTREPVPMPTVETMTDPHLPDAPAGRIPDTGAPMELVEDAGSGPIVEPEVDSGPMTDPESEPEPELGCSLCESTTSGLSCYPSTESDDWGQCWHPSRVGSCRSFRPHEDVWLDSESDSQYVTWQVRDDSYERYICPLEMKQDGFFAPYKLPSECVLKQESPALYDCPRIAE